MALLITCTNNLNQCVTQTAVRPEFLFLIRILELIKGMTMSIALNFFKLVVLINYVSLNMTLDRLKCFELGYSYWEDLMRRPCIIASIEGNSVEPSAFR